MDTTSDDIRQYVNAMKVTLEALETVADELEEIESKFERIKDLMPEL